MKPAEPLTSDNATPITVHLLETSEIKACWRLAARSRALYLAADEVLDYTHFVAQLKRNTVFVFRVNGFFAGFVCFEPSDSTRTARLHALFEPPRLRALIRSGCITQLLQAWCQRQQLTQLIACPLPWQHRTRRLLERFGFKPVSTGMGDAPYRYAWHPVQNAWHV
jgi:hypothetical protein